MKKEIIKSYTDYSQAQILRKILPDESADMSWVSNGLGKPFARTIPIKGDPEELCGCWSLAALLSVVPEVSLNSFKDGDWNAMVKQNGKMIYSDTNNPVDACYEIILKLNELNLL